MVDAYFVAGIVVYLVVAGGLVLGLEWFGPVIWHRAFFPFAEPGISAVGPAATASLVVAGAVALAMRRRHGLAGALFTGALFIVPSALLLAWLFHAANAIADRSPESQVEYRVVGYRPKAFLDRVVLERVVSRPAVVRRCVRPGVLGGWPPPNAPVHIRIRAGALGWRWISGFDWDSRRFPELSGEERRRFWLSRPACVT
jgi:hypothetical protein